MKVLVSISKESLRVTSTEGYCNPFIILILFFIILLLAVKMKETIETD